VHKKQVMLTYFGNGAAHCRKLGCDCIEMQGLSCA
jgi:hypothetical protein